MRELMRAAAGFGLEVHASHLPENVRGYYSPTERRIYFDLSLTPSERRGAIAHELGHFHHGHDCSSPSNERQADIYAARMLIHPDDYARAARYTRERHALAEELNVPVDVVEAFEKYCLTRIGDEVHTSKRIRGSAWRYRVE